MKTKLKFEHLPGDYKELLAYHMLRPIHDQVSYNNTLEIADLMAGKTLTKDQEDYFEALCLLIEAYENSSEALPPQKGLSLLQHLIEENELSAAELARILGVDRSLGVRILNGERHITVSHAKKLAKRFHLPLDIFLI